MSPVGQSERRRVSRSRNWAKVYMSRSVYLFHLTLYRI